ncbi:MAG: 1-deoxy-D-xylulose-5-phosphate reductoisomerase [Clostridiales bacterium]|jgi:1-deoxy-D-xylulose-5-phosphate reductoisomerase|nr:1-deoxy-D-xylulose-5-phosphate reductoisomerase [Clostridiales bacterium]
MRIGIFGASGSIGGRTLDVIDMNRDKFEIVFLSAHGSEEKLAAAAERFLPACIALTDDKYKESASERARFDGLIDRIKNRCVGYNPTVIYGSDYYRELFCGGGNPFGIELAVVAVTGIYGLMPSYLALKSGVSLALANKEALVAGGGLITREAEANGADIFPIDSEHSAVSECLNGNARDSVRRLILTASGGAFRGYSAERLKTARAEDALKHPTWRMGRKVTVDSATLMNKGLEIIEAMRLFDMPEHKIDVLIHPESIVHSMVEFCDNTTMAMMSVPDMRIPVSRALGRCLEAYNERFARKEKEERSGGARAAFPDIYGGGLPANPSNTLDSGYVGERAVNSRNFSDSERNVGRLPNPSSALNLTATGALTFFEPDTERFPCLRIARDAARADGIMPAVLNAANELAAADFLEGRIGFTDIAERIESVLDGTENYEPKSIYDILDAGAEAARLYGELDRKTR